MKGLTKLSTDELIEMIKIERQRVRFLEKRMDKLDKIWRNFYRNKK